MNRHERRKAEAIRRQRPAPSEDRATIMQLAVEAILASDTASGATLILPGGETLFLDRDQLERGGRA